MAGQLDGGKIAQFLNSTEIFQGIDEASRAQIASACATRDFPKGTVIVRQGSEGDTLFIIAQGQVEILVEDDVGGLEQVVAELGTLEAFGEMSLLLEQPRTASVRAKSDVSCIILGREAFHRVIMALPVVGLTVSRNLARRLVETTRQSGPRLVSLREHPFDPELYSSITTTVLERHQMVPLKMDGDTLVVAMTRPTDPAALEALRAAARGFKLRPAGCSDEDYRTYMNDVVRPQLGHPIQEAGPAAAVHGNYNSSELAFVETEQQRQRGGEVSGEAVVRVLNEILVDAINRGASDIHIEPTISNLKVRFRVDGRMVVYRDDYNPRFHAPVVSRLKILGGMDIAEKRRPQDGRASFRVRERLFDTRMNTLPSLHGEKMVMRLLDSESVVVPLTNLILSEGLAGVVRSALFRTTGSIIVVGPTGSGKTTTLYSAIHERKETSNDVNIVTVEDPIEYTIDGVTQTQVDSANGMTFARALRALLRQDPDVMLIGETRDTETAQIALEGALTGHLVLTTLHAESAVEAITRLVEMDCAPYLVASAVDLVIAQRLLRRLCGKCAKPHAYSDMVRLNLERANILPMDQTESLYKGQGCAACGQTGFSGRVGAYEVLRFDDLVREAIGNGESDVAIRRIAEETRTITTFKQYAAFLVRGGLTTPQEVLRMFGTI